MVARGKHGGGGGLEGDVRKGHEESFGFHGCVHYLDREDGFMGQKHGKTYQIVHFVPFLVYHFGLNQSCKNRSNITTSENNLENGEEENSDSPLFPWCTGKESICVSVSFKIPIISHKLLGIGVIIFLCFID